MALKSIVTGLVIAVLAAGPTAAPTTVLAQDEAPQSPQDMMQDATRLMLQALELMIKSIPQYEAPVVLENGDILIRRKRKGGDESPDDAFPGDGEPDRDTI